MSFIAPAQVEETIKWNFPHFMHHGMLCAMAAFKEHVRVLEECDSGQGPVIDATRWDSSAASPASELLPAPKILGSYIKKAMQLNEAGIKSARKTPRKPAFVVPDDLSQALKKNRKAAATFAGFGQANGANTWSEQRGQA